MAPSLCREMWADGQAMRRLKKEDVEHAKMKDELMQRRKKLRDARKESRAAERLKPTDLTILPRRRRSASS